MFLLLGFLAVLFIALVVSTQGWTMLFAIIGLIWTISFIIRLIVKGFRKLFRLSHPDCHNSPNCPLAALPRRDRPPVSSPTLPDDAEAISSEDLGKWMRDNPKGWRVKGG